MALLLAGAGAAQTYTAVDLGILGTGATPAAVNSSGQVAGSYENASALPRPFLAANGIIGDLGALSTSPSAYGNAVAINNRGQVVGESLVDSGIFHVFLYSDGSLIDLDPGDFESAGTAINSQGLVAGYAAVEAGQNYFAAIFSGGRSLNLGTVPGGGSCQAEGINDNAQVVGFCNIGASNFHAFLYNQGKMTDLHTAGGLQASLFSWAYAINNRGQVAGYLETAGGQTHAFLYTARTVTDLGVLAGYDGSVALGINDFGQVVGYVYQNAGVDHAFLWSGGTMTDLNSLVALPNGAYLVTAAGINAAGQIAAQGSDGHAYLLMPATASLAALNPFARYAATQQAPPVVNIQTMLAAPIPAESLAADGESAVVLVYKSSSSQPVTFTLSTPGTVLPAGALPGSFGAFDPDFLLSPHPVTGLTSLQIASPTFGLDATNQYAFLALLWAPAAMPAANTFPSVPVRVTASQQGQTTAQVNVNLEPPPLLLVHDLWSNAAGAGFASGTAGFYDYLAAQYPHNLIFPVDYGAINSKSFADPGVQNVFSSNLADALAQAAQDGIAARSVDVVAHGMGGLVGRYFVSTPPFAPDLPANPVHDLITIGTPHQGTQLATTLVADAGLTAGGGGANPEIAALCINAATCSLGAVMNAAGKALSSGAVSIEPGSAALKSLSSSNTFSTIAGTSPSPLSTTETLLNLMVSGFVGQTVTGILGATNDTMVTTASQSPAGVVNAAPPISGIVHGSLCGSCDVGETASPVVWQQVFYWLTGGTGMAPAGASAQSLVAEARAPRPETSAGPAPVLNLSGYTQVAATNVSFQPAAGSTLTIGAPGSITATSGTKTISEVLLLQIAADPSDTVLQYVTQAPFSIAFTPARLGTVNFGAITVFSDKTYALTSLNYTLQTSGSPYALNLLNVPVAALSTGSSRVVGAQAVFSTGPLNVTAAATYTTASGTTNVFSVSAGGTVTANGAGVDTLVVSYGGLTATAPIAVGTCTYSLTPANQIMPSSAGSAAIQVLTQPGCAWTAAGGAPWLTFVAASGAGNGPITMTAAANSGSSPQSALITLGGASAIVTQPVGTCSYNLSANQVNAPAGGASGTITATSTCPVVASSNQSWLTVLPLGPSVSYTVQANSAVTTRNAILTIGTVNIPVTQSGFVCAIGGAGMVSIADVQQMINELFGMSSPANDVNGDRGVNVVDLQIVVNAVLGLGCTG